MILLLHGFPTSGHMFRDLIPALSYRYRVIAPDLPGFGETKTPARGTFAYTFDNLAKMMEDFADALGLKRYAIYISTMALLLVCGGRWRSRSGSPPS